MSAVDHVVGGIVETAGVGVPDDLRVKNRVTAEPPGCAPRDVKQHARGEHGGSLTVDHVGGVHQRDIPSRTHGTGRVRRCVGGVIEPLKAAHDARRGRRCGRRRDALAGRGVCRRLSSGVRAGIGHEKRRAKHPPSSTRRRSNASRDPLAATGRDPRGSSSLRQVRGNRTC